jgi:hypothetical protein
MAVIVTKLRLNARKAVKDAKLVEKAKAAAAARAAARRK